jgi:hypothetical protein
MIQPGDNLPWQQLVDRKMLDLIEQIAAAHEWVRVHGNADPAFFQDMAADHFQWLRELYGKELPLAKMLEESDLTVELRGPAAMIGHPRLNIVTSTFTKVRRNVAQVTKAVAGVRDPNSDEAFHMPETMELGFSSIVRNGSVHFGFSLPRPEEDVLKANDPLYQAVVSAVEAIKQVSFSLSELDSEAAIEQNVKQYITDPKLRDSALIAVRELAPSGRSHGINAVTIAGGEIRPADIKPLTIDSRRTVRHILATPVRRTEVITITGTVRETDLDDKRFEVRGIEEGCTTDLRCIYGHKVTDRIASSWLNQRVEVRGRVERDAAGRARLMKVANLRLVDAPADAQQQIEFEFPDEAP